MASKSVPKDLIEKSKARLTEFSEKQAAERQKIWELGAAKRELNSRFLAKLLKDDQEMQKLMEEAQKRSFELSKRPLPKLSPPKYDIAVQDLAPIGIHLRFPWQLTWSWDSGSPKVNQATKSGEMTFYMDTDNSNPNQQCRNAVGDWFQPNEGAGWMTVTSNVFITYNYGNHAVLRHSHTHAWIGFFIQEWDGTYYVQDNVSEQRNLWDLGSDDDFSGTNTIALSVTIPVVSNHQYVIWVWAGGDVESNAQSYAALGTTPADIFIRLS